MSPQDPSSPRPRTRRPPPRQSPHIYWRRRAIVVVASGAIVWMSLWLVTGIGGWLGGDESEAAEGAQTATQIAEDPVEATEVTCAADIEELERGDEPAPADLTVALDTALAHRSLNIRPTGVSMWVDGYGIVAESNADELLAPASNQKIITAMGALELLDHDARLDTQLYATGPVTNGVVEGDIVWVGGGDPLIKRVGPHSLEDLAARLADEGIAQVSGGIVGDESRYDQIRRAPGWLDWEMPLPGGAMSALMVNSNSRIGEQAYLQNPTQHNVSLLATALENAGVQVDGESHPGDLPTDAEPLFTYSSPTIAEIIDEMLRQSDNMAAEMLTKEIGLQASGEGSTEAGMAATVAALQDSLCVEIDGLNDDASGISRENRRSAGSWQELLLAATGAEWFDTFYDGLPTSGTEDGTLAGRFLGTPAEGDVHAKTGTIGTAVALSGYLETEGGRLAAFSIVANGTDPEPAVPAIDAVVIALASDPG